MGNAWFAAATNYLLEKDFRDLPLDRTTHYDAIMILGGGTGENPSGAPQLDSEGDRVMLGARFFRRGQTDWIVCSGAGSVPNPDAPMDSATVAALLLVDVGVPPERVICVGGQRTIEEIEELKSLVSENGWRKVGLVTSAWHMRRAMQLARAAGLDVHPLAADFRSGFNAKRARIADLIPSATAWRDVNAAWREFMASVAGP